jgi:HEAT repeat protein
VNAGQSLLIAGAAIALACATAVAVTVLASPRKGKETAKSRAALAPYRRALIVLVAGEDVDGQAKAVLCALPPPVWARLRPTVIAFLTKVCGAPADSLGDLMRAHGEIDQATKMLTSRSAVRRARAAYLLGVVGDQRNVTKVLPLLGDRVADVRLVAAQALGAIGDPCAASAVLRAVPAQHGQHGLPTWVATEVLLAMGLEIGPVLHLGLVSKDPAVRKVCAVVAGRGGYLTAAPQLRILLVADSDSEIRASAAVALGRVGGPHDAAALTKCTDAGEPIELRRTCVIALGDLGYRESLATLIRLLGDDDPRLADLAADSLVRIGPEGIAKLEIVAAVPQEPSARAASGALEHVGLRWSAGGQGLAAMAMRSESGHV